MIHYVAGATRKHHVTIQNVHRATRTRAKWLKMLLAPQQNTTLRSKMCTAPHAPAQKNWNCCWRHRNTPRYDPKCAPRHTHTHRKIENVAGATGIHHVTIQTVHRAKGKRWIITSGPRGKKKINIVFLLFARTTLRSRVFLAPATKFDHNVRS